MVENKKRKFHLPLNKAFPRMNSSDWLEQFYYFLKNQMVMDRREEEWKGG
jgi:hypothetical protein